MAARTLDTLTQMKSRIDPKILNTGERTIELEISAADLHKLLVLAAVRRNASGTAAETQQPQQPVATSALLKSSPRKHVDATNSNSYRFASTCASREPDNAQHSGVTSSPQQQQQQQTLTSASQQQHKAIGTNIARPTPTPRLPSYIFRHRGTVPSEPQAIDSLQFILNQKPLGATTLVSGNEGTRLFMLGTHMDSEVRTAEEAREKARLRLQELNDIVQSASGLMAALTKAQVAHDAKVVGRAAQLIPLANNDQLLDAEVLEEDGSEGFSRRKLAIVASSVLGISSAAVCLGVLLAPEFVGFV
ncbi:hypothetical protein GGH93_006261 [Coemansia aciculifera]|nr:hypothetical protein GGH93_006261 [Coemansia aciculifera]